MFRVHFLDIAKIEPSPDVLVGGILLIGRQVKFNEVVVFNTHPASEASVPLHKSHLLKKIPSKMNVAPLCYKWDWMDYGAHNAVLGEP